MRVKLTKSVVINSVSNTEATRAGQVVGVDDTEGKELVKAGYAEETSSKVTAEPRKAAEPADNKMAADPDNKDTGTAARAAAKSTGKRE